MNNKTKQELIDWARKNSFWGDSRIQRNVVVGTVVDLWPLLNKIEELSESAKVEEEHPQSLDQIFKKLHK